MSFIKLGEATTANIIDSLERLDAIAADPEIIERFKKYADNLKKIAPKAKDFLYFTAVMMHAAEASILDENGEIKKDSSGKLLSAGWEKNGDSLRWVCSDKNIKAYKNSNGDIFPEDELLKAHKRWIGKPLCLDHKSSSVDFVRGLIVDTFYDNKHKRVIALCALDKVNYPDLARKVSTGYSNNCSMGTAVGRAICTDCGRVARVESDFCDHMRNKSCYGEINCDLNPIELSIVVNGADPKAKIKHIIAKDLSKAADAMSQYLESKAGAISTDELKALRNEFQSLSARVDKLVVKASADEGEADGPTESLETMVEPEMGEESMLPPNPPEPIPTWFASASANKLESIVNRLEAKISHLQEELNKFSKNEELTMTNKKEAYFQGAGGVNEPTPGQVKYPNKDDQEAIRDGEDRQMVGQSPFPGTGPVDGMHPGPSSAGESEEQRKRRLQRLAEAEERRIRREAALEKVKEGYFQGGGDVNEPTPGKPKYPNKDDYRTQRDKQDKQMTGQPPFPGVGDTDGLHPSPASADQKDELKRKQMLSRAKLSAKFVKAATPTGTPDRGNSRWDIYSNAESGGAHLILSATVDQLTGGKSDLMFESVATKEFGLSLLNKIKTQGFERTAALIKGAQMAAPPAAPMPAATPPAMAPPPPPPSEEELDAPEGSGDPADSVKELTEDLADLTQDASQKASDLEEAVEAMAGDSVALDKVPEAAPEEFEAKTASLESLQSMRKTLNTMLREAMQESATELRASAAELMLAQSAGEKYGSFSAKEKGYYKALAGDARAAAKQSLADAKQLMGAFVKYAHGTDNLLKRAKAEFTMRKMGQTMSPPDTMDVKPDESGGEAMGEKNYGLLPVDTRRPGLERKLPERQRGTAVPGTAVAPKVPTEADPKSKGTLIPHPAPGTDTGSAADGVSLEVSDDMKVSDLERLVDSTPGLDLSTKAGRAEYRAKLAQKGLKFQDLLNQAHPGGGFTTALDVKPTGDLAKVETLEETHNKMMDIALAPPKVRKQAADIAKLVESGQISAAEVGDLVSYGVDAEAVKYWKQYYAEAKDSEATDFAKKLVQDTVKQKTAEEQQKNEMKIKRAYDLAYEMRDASMIEHNQVKDQVEEILKWNDDGFDSMKRVIAKQAMRKQASAVPQVGMLGTGDVILPSFSTDRKEEGDLVSALSSVFAGRKY